MSYAWEVLKHKFFCGIEALLTPLSCNSHSISLVLAGSDGLYLVVDEQGTFREDNFQKAVASMTETAVDGKGIGGSKNGGAKGGKDASSTGEGSDIYKIVRMIMERNYDPGRVG